VSVYRPGGVLEVVVIVRVAAEPIVDVGLTDADAPEGTFKTEPKVTCPDHSLRVIETVEVIVPWAMVCADGLTESVKVAAFCLTTMSVSVTVCDRDALVAVIVG
jgi:hypothetical protein